MPTGIYQRTEKNWKHHMRKTKEYGVWQAMKNRCYGEKTEQYKNYGAKGIAVCDRWRNSFENFIKDMGRSPVGMSLDRINPQGNYEPNNCRWTDMKTQANNRTNNRIIFYKNKKLTMKLTAEKYGIHYKALWYRLKTGWTIERALTTKVRKIRKHASSRLSWRHY